MKREFYKYILGSLLITCFFFTACNKEDKELPEMEEGIDVEEPVEEEPEEEEPNDNSESTDSPFGDNPLLTQLASPVNGEPGDTAGRAVALSGDGVTMVIGSPGADVAAGTSGGLVRVYVQNGGWGEFGTALESPQANKNFGAALSLNEAGTILAIGDSASGLGGNLAGLVRIFKLQGGAWLQNGNDIYGAAELNSCGTSVALSASGNRVVVGSPLNDDVADDSGHVRVFDLVGNTWEQVGNSIEGSSKDDLFGNSVSISDDGNIIAVSAPGANRVSMYELSGDEWMLLGNSLNANQARISLSGNGKVIVVGEPKINADQGKVSAYEYTNGSWLIKGISLTGDEDGDMFGNSVSINQNGTVLIAGAERHEVNGNNSGQAKVFHFKNGDWKQIGNPITGQKGSYQGFSVAINSKGDLVASGAWAWSELDNGSATGQVVTYKIE